MTHSLRKVPSSLLCLAFLVSLGGLGCGQATESGGHDPGAGAGEAGANAAPDAPDAPARVDLRPSAEGGARAVPSLPCTAAAGSGPADGAGGSSPRADGDAPVAALREVSQTLTAVPALTGVVSSASDGRRYGFVTFDVGQLPPNIQKLERAVVHTGPYVVGEPIPVYHVAFDELAPAAVTDGGLQLLAILPRGTSGAQLIPSTIADLLAPDYLARSESDHYSQYRFDLPATTTEADAVTVAGLLSTAAVDLDYLLP